MFSEIWPCLLFLIQEKWGSYLHKICMIEQINLNDLGLGEVELLIIFVLK